MSDGDQAYWPIKVRLGDRKTCQKCQTSCYHIPGRPLPPYLRFRFRTVTSSAATGIGHLVSWLDRAPGSFPGIFEAYLRKHTTLSTLSTPGFVHYTPLHSSLINGVRIYTGTSLNATNQMYPYRCMFSYLLTLFLSFRMSIKQYEA